VKNPAERVLVLLLRVVGCVELLALLPTVMPRAWMALIHEHIGLGTFPPGPIVEYLARALSAFYAFHGGLLLLLSTDVRRYAVVLTYAAVTIVGFGVLAIAVDVWVGMPWWWTAGEGPFLVLFGIVLLALQARVRGACGKSPAEPS